MTKLSSTTSALAMAVLVAAATSSLLVATTAPAAVSAQGVSIPPLDTGALFKQKRCPKACDQWSPCCVQGYCVNKPFACMTSEGCVPDQTFGGKCTPIPMCKSFREDFNDASVLIDKYDMQTPDQARMWREYPGADHATVENGNLVLELQWSDKDGRGQGATIPTLRWVQFGTISARIKTAGGRGVVNSFITKTTISDETGDEIDFEMLGGNVSEVQTNFYWNGQIDYTKGARWKGGNGFATDGDYHTYTIDWKPDGMKFFVDDTLIRSVTPAQVGNKYPAQIARVFFSIWDAGCNMPEGTVQWAGGETDWCKDAAKRATPKRMYVDWLEVKCMTEDPRPLADYIPNIAKPSNGTAGDAGMGGFTPNMPPRTTNRTTTGVSAGGANAGDAIGSGNAAAGGVAASVASVVAAAVIAVAALAL
ncbi:putative glycosidase CRH2 [Blastocladiella emersonii ATCC 22665]|nr:putative glycosidase CRH2 [Blastocladiella emersonii ATCC 22665]